MADDCGGLAQLCFPSDLFCAVTECTEDLVALRAWRTTEEGLPKRGLPVVNVFISTELMSGEGLTACRASR